MPDPLPVCAKCLKPHEPTCPVTGGRAATTTVYRRVRSARRIRTAFAIWAWTMILACVAAAVARADTAAWQGVDVPEVCQQTETVNINTSTPEQLKLLYGVGDVLAGRIVEGRPFAAVEDLEAVSGIGPAKLAANLHHLAVDGETTLAVKVPKPETVEGAPTTWRRVERCQ